MSRACLPQVSRRSCKRSKSDSHASQPELPSRHGHLLEWGLCRAFEPCDDQVVSIFRKSCTLWLDVVRESVWWENSDGSARISAKLTEPESVPEPLAVAMMRHVLYAVAVQERL